MKIDETSLEDFLLANLVIGNRVWRMASGHPGARREIERMLSEKVKAATDGYWAVAQGLVKGDPGTWEDPARTFVEPGRKTLRKNARRLAGYRG